MSVSLDRVQSRRDDHPKYREAGRRGWVLLWSARRDTYLAKHAYRNDLAGIGRAYVILESRDAAEMLGCSTLSASNATPEILLPVLGGTLPKYALPMSYIGTFAVAANQQGKGVGTELMIDAMMRIVAGADLVGSTGIFLQPRDEKSTMFYEKMGFTALGIADTHRPFFMPMGTVHRVIALTISRHPAGSVRRGVRSRDRRRQGPCRSA